MRQIDWNLKCLAPSRGIEKYYKYLLLVCNKQKYKFPNYEKNNIMKMDKHLVVGVNFQLFILRLKKCSVVIN